MATKTLINDPLISEFLFDVIWAATQKDKAKLSERQLRNITTVKRAKRYSSYTTLDEKLIMLSKLGVSFALTVFRTKTHSPKQLKELFEKYKANLDEDAVTDVLKSGLALTTDREIQCFSNLLGALCHSDTYMLNRDFYKAGLHAQRWKDTPHPTTENVREAMADFEVVNKMFLKFSLFLKHIKGVTNIGDVDFNILMFLFTKRNTYAHRKEIDIYFKPNYKPALIAAALKRLLENVLIEKSPMTLLRDSYMITGTGIEEIMTAHKRTLNETFNF